MQEKGTKPNNNRKSKNLYSWENAKHFSGRRHFTAPLKNLIFYFYKFYLSISHLLTENKQKYDPIRQSMRNPPACALHYPKGACASHSLLLSLCNVSTAIT